MYKFCEVKTTRIRGFDVQFSNSSDLCKGTEMTTISTTRGTDSHIDNFIKPKVVILR